MKYIVITVVLILLIALALLAYYSYRLDNEPDKGNLEASLDIEIKNFLRTNNVKSLVVGVIKQGRTYVKGYGSEVPDETTVFQIGSISKIFTALLLQILCDEGTVHMEMTLDELIGTRIKLSPVAKKITLRQLATHTSGLPSVPKSILDYINGKVGEASLMVNPYSHVEPDLVYEYLATTEENHKVGKFLYSNYGMGLLGHVLELVSGRSYETLLLEKVLIPLTMSNTRINLTPEMERFLVKGYTSKGKETPLWTFKALEGAGAMNSNAVDMLKFINANFENNTSISNALIKMREPQFGGSTGIGWMKPAFLDKFFKNKNIDWHNGMVGGYASYLSIDNENKAGVFVIINKSVDVTMLGIQLTRVARTQSWSKFRSITQK